MHCGKRPLLRATENQLYVIQKTAAKIRHGLIENVKSLQFPPIFNPMIALEVALCRLFLLENSVKFVNNASRGMSKKKFIRTVLETADKFKSVFFYFL